MADFLHHEVSEEEKQEIKEKAGNLMKSFSEKLDKIDKKLEESFVQRDECERKELKDFEAVDWSFSREIMFDNAPNKNDDFIIAEKKKW